MNTAELKALLSSVRDRTKDATFLLPSQETYEMGEPNESARAALDALQLYLQNTDELINWINNNLPESVKLLNSLASPSSSIDFNEPIPTKEYGEFTEENALKLLEDYGKLSTSLLQRKFYVGYAKGAKMIDALAEKGYIQHTPQGWIKTQK